MRRLTFLFQGGVLLLISFNELSLFQNAKHQVNASLVNKYTCQNDVMRINCGSKVIKIYWAKYLRLDSKICSNGSKTAEYCSPVEKTSEVRRLCSGKAACNISVDEKTMGDCCPDINTEYLNVLYSCQTPPTSESPCVPKKSTMVLTKPSKPSLPLNKTTTPSLSSGTISSKPTEQQEEPDEERDDEQEDDEGSEGHVSDEVVHFVLLGGAYISTYPTIFTILPIFIVTIL